MKRRLRRPQSRNRSAVARKGKLTSVPIVPVNISVFDTVLTHYKLVLGVVIALVGSGFAASVYLGRFALASELQPVTTSVSKHEALLSEIRESLDWERDQLFQIARSVGAPTVPSKGK